MAEWRHVKDVAGQCWALLNSSPEGWSDVVCGCTSPTPDPASPCARCGLAPDHFRHLMFGKWHIHQPVPTRCTCGHAIERA